jgi:hypothetical protein
VYANLEVNVKEDDKPHGTYFAWNVTVTEDGTVFVYEDLQTGEGSYPEEGPVHIFPPGTRVEIGACF